MHRNRLRRRQRHGVWAGVFALVLGLGGMAHAGPRDDMKAAYDLAKSQFNELELDSAVATLEAAVARAQGANMAADPALAPLLVLRGGIIYSNSGDRSRTVAAFQEAVRADYYVTLPIELRSEELQGLLEEARASVPQPSTGPIAHTPPVALPGQDVSLEALSSVALAEGITMVLYWRKAGSDAAFAALYLETFGNLGTAVIPAAQHGDTSIEYFFYVYNANQQALANLGDKDSPLVLELSGGATPSEGEGEGDGEGEDKGKRRSSTQWPRAYINLGVGTGIGIARGTAEQTYQQFNPSSDVQYGLPEQSCAVARWIQGDLPPASSQAEFQQHLIRVPAEAKPASDADMVAAYNPAQCGRRHPVTTGFASAPFHLAPEVAVRIHERDIGDRRSLSLVLGVYGRLQVVTGSNVVTENPNLAPEISFLQEVSNPNPPGFQREPPFTWAVGAKLKALIAKRGGKLHGMVGLFGGYGNTRLRVNMNFSNDRNGNSVPDRAETAISGPTNDMNQVSEDDCTPVWPYLNGCMLGSEGELDQSDARAVQANSPSDEFRIDTVKLGPAFIGALFGVHYQLHKNFGLFAEVDVGGWFPDIGSMLIDINAGPSITF